MGDEVPQVHVHLHNNPINQFGSVQGHIRCVGGGNEVRKGKNAPCLS